MDLKFFFVQTFSFACVPENITDATQLGAGQFVGLMCSHERTLQINTLILFHSWSPFMGTQEPKKLTYSQQSGSIAQLVEHYPGTTEVMCLNPVQAT